MYIKFDQRNWTNNKVWISVQRVRFEKIIIPTSCDIEKKKRIYNLKLSKEQAVFLIASILVLKYMKLTVIFRQKFSSAYF